VTSSTPPTATATAELSPVLQQIVDERRLYEMNLGKAMDTLRADYSTLLIQSPGMHCCTLYCSLLHFTFYFYTDTSHLILHMIV